MNKSINCTNWRWEVALGVSIVVECIVDFEGSHELNRGFELTLVLGTYRFTNTLSSGEYMFQPPMPVSTLFFAGKCMFQHLILLASYFGSIGIWKLLNERCIYASYKDEYKCKYYTLSMLLLTQPSLFVLAVHRKQGCGNCLLILSDVTRRGRSLATDTQIWKFFKCGGGGKKGRIEVKNLE